VAIFVLGLAAAAGSAAIYSGLGGISYALTKSPIPDRAGDLFVSGMLVAIGGLAAIFAVRWLLAVIRSIRGTAKLERGEKKEGEQKEGQTPN
jgi:hypothetical protein